MADGVRGVVAEALVRNVLVDLEGRGRVGKSTLGRWLIDRARNGGRLVVVADGDRNNATLAGFYSDALRPVSAEADDVNAWLMGLLNSMADHGQPIVLDMSGGDPALSEFTRELPLAEFCQDNGARHVAMLLIGPEPDDLAHAATVYENGHFRPEDTVLVMNAGLVAKGRDPERAFAAVLDMPELRDMLAKGVQSVVMPRLDAGAMADVGARRLGFYEALAGKSGIGGTPIGAAQRVLVRLWLQKMEQAFAPVVGLLP